MKRIIVSDRVGKEKTFARSLFDGALPVDMVITGSLAATERPSILSRRGEKEEGEDPSPY